VEDEIAARFPPLQEAIICQWQWGELDEHNRFSPEIEQRELYLCLQFNAEPDDVTDKLERSLIDRPTTSQSNDPVPFLSEVARGAAYSQASNLKRPIMTEPADFVRCAAAYPHHPAMERMATASLADYDTLKRSVKEHGLRVPLILFVEPNGKEWLIDGRSRVKAMEELGIPVVGTDRVLDTTTVHCAEDGREWTVRCNGIMRTKTLTLTRSSLTSTWRVVS
jgi:hypothetical protein